MEVLAKGGSAKEKASRAASAAGRAGGRGGIVAGVAVEARVPTPQMGRFFFPHGQEKDLFRSGGSSLALL